MKILVTGGAGYVGSHMVLALHQRGFHVVTLDNLSTGHQDAVTGGAFVLGDLARRNSLDALFQAHRFGAVMHFAASSQVAESIAEPARYHRNNVVNTVNLLDAMVRHGVTRLIFSSSAAIFGEPGRLPVDEDHPKRPLNPYGRSKLMIEQILHDYGQAYGLRYTCLRYFNAAGAEPSGRIGERHHPETHLIPLVLQVAAGRRDRLNVYGCDYPTPDGTCIRDYVHVSDLCEAHLLALERLAAGEGSAAFNLGNGNGYSVQQTIDTAQAVTGRAIRTHDAPRRAGDPARLVADAARAHRELNWTPRYPGIREMVAHAWQWEQREHALSRRAQAGRLSAMESEVLL